MKLKFKREHIDAKLPTFGSKGAAGLDVYARLDAPVTIPAGQSLSISTGIAVELPTAHFELQVRGRSGLAFKNRVVAFNGTIDSDYRGEINVLLFNMSTVPFIVNPNDRIAQLVLNIVSSATIEPVFVEDLKETERGVKGFGSTGVS